MVEGRRKNTLAILTITAFLFATGAGAVGDGPVSDGPSHVGWSNIFWKTKHMVRNVIERGRNKIVNRKNSPSPTSSFYLWPYEGCSSH